MPGWATAGSSQQSFYNNLYLNFNAYYSRRLDPGTYQSANFNANINGQMKNLWYVGCHGRL